MTKCLIKGIKTTFLYTPLLFDLMELYVHVCKKRFSMKEMKGRNLKKKYLSLSDQENCTRYVVLQGDAALPTLT